MPSIRDKEEIQSPAFKEEQSVRAEGQETRNYAPASIQNRALGQGEMKARRPVSFPGLLEQITQAYIVA